MTKKPLCAIISCVWGSFGVCFGSHKPVALHYWYGAWQRERVARR